MYRSTSVEEKAGRYRGGTCVEEIGNRSKVAHLSRGRTGIEAAHVQWERT